MSTSNANVILSESSNTSAGNINANAATQQINVNLAQYRLPIFNSDDVESWFFRAEAVFREHNIHTEEAKFNKLLELVDTSSFGILRDILCSNSVDKYSLARQRLIQVYGKSRDANLMKLLQSTSENLHGKPSFLLYELRNRGGNDLNNDRLIKVVWLQKLPERAREVLAINPELDLDQQAAIADRLFEIYENPVSHTYQQISVVEKTKNFSRQNDFVPQMSNSSSDNTLENVISMLTNLQAQVSALQVDKRSSRSHERRNYGRYKRSRQNSPFYRNRSKTPVNTSEADIVDGLCWYHRTFGDKSFKCKNGCMRYRTSKNE